MRPTTSIMLQQNNNNNYPCLNVSGSTREMLQKCSRASLPFPSRLELGLGDLPLIRGLRAWALCSKNRCKANGLLGGGQAPTAPPGGRGSSTPSPRPADVYLSGEWGRMGYGLPLGLDARQAGIGALVTVATLKTSEGSGKTQTQCLFLRTEKGSCLYSTAKPGSGMATSAASSVVGGWLRGKTGRGGGRDTPAGRRDNGSTLPAQTGANRVRVRSGRRWRKSGNAASREKTAVSRERRQRSGEDPAGERQEDGDKGGLDVKQFPSLQQDSRRGGVCRSPRCCHNVSPKTCAQHGKRVPRRGSQDEGEGGESPRRGIPNGLNSEVKGMRKESQRNEEEEKGGLCDSNNFHAQTPSGCDGEEIREADSNEEPKTKISHSMDSCSEEEQDTYCEITKVHTGNNDFIHVLSEQSTHESRQNRGFDAREPMENPCEGTVVNASGFSDDVEADKESERKMERVLGEEEERSVNQTPAEFSGASISAALCPESSTPAGGSICPAVHQPCWLKSEQENSQEEHLEGGGLGQADPHGFMGKEELESNTVKPLLLKNEENSSQMEEREASSSRLRLRDPSVFEIGRRTVTENACNCKITGTERRDELQSEEKNIEERPNLEVGAEAEERWRRECPCCKLDLDSGSGTEGRTEEGANVSTVQEDDNNKEVKRDCASEDNKRFQEPPGDGCWGRKNGDGGTCSETNIAYAKENRETGTNISNAACADPSTSLTLSPANPDPSLPPLGSMATGLPCLEEEEELRVTAGDGGQEGKRRHGRELEEQGEEEEEEERGSTVATAEGRKEEEEDEFGVFMQAEGEPAWSEGGVTMSASVPCGSRQSDAHGDHTVTGESTHWTPGWTDDPFHQSEDTSWTAFPQDSSVGGQDVAGQWWPISAVEERRGGLLANQNPVAIFAEAFPSLSGSTLSETRDLDVVATLTQLLRGRARQDQGLLDSFHDLNKMIGQRYKRASGVSRDLLLQTLHLEQPHAESRQPAPWTTNRRLSPGLPLANQHTQNVAAKRRLSYDYNRNITE